MSEKYAFVMMIHEKWWNGFQQRSREGREAHSYVQRGVAPPKDAKFMFFYVAKPVAEIAGYAEFVERRVGETDEMWEALGNESVLSSKEVYDEFLKDCGKASFIRFKNLKEAIHPIALNNVLMLLGLNRFSRKGFYVDKGTAEKLIMIMS
jgi:predicted transcriptional regulator